LIPIEEGGAFTGLVFEYFKKELTQIIKSAWYMAAKSPKDKSALRYRQ